jgi:hypothetical protein
MEILFVGLGNEGVDMKDEALRLALEALAQDRAWLESDAPKEVWDKNNDAITAIKAALEQPEPEPVGQLCEVIYGRGQVMWFNKPDDGAYVYTSTPKREWQGLTDDEIDMIYQGAGKHDLATAREIEAKLKEKNT